MANVAGQFICPHCYEIAQETIAEERQEKAYRFLQQALTFAADSDSPLYPVVCPRCASVRVTRIIGTTHLECLDCQTRYKLEEVSER
jgi:phage FluMu protein Com